MPRDAFITATDDRLSRLPWVPATADRHPGTNGWLSSWGTPGEIAGCPPPRRATRRA